MELWGTGAHDNFLHEKQEKEVSEKEIWGDFYHLLSKKN